MHIQSTSASKQVLPLDQQRYDFLDPKKISLAFSAAIAASSAALLAVGNFFAAPESSVDSTPTLPSPIYPPKYVRIPSPHPAVTPPPSSISPILPPSDESLFSLEPLYKIVVASLVLTVIAACCFQRKEKNNQPEIQQQAATPLRVVSASSSENNFNSAATDSDPKGKEPEDSGNPDGSFVMVEEMGRNVYSPISAPSSNTAPPTGWSYLNSMTLTANWVFSTSTTALQSMGSTAWSYYSPPTTAPRTPASAPSPNHRAERNSQALGPMKPFLQLALEHQESALETILAERGTSLDRLLQFLGTQKLGLCFNLGQAIHALRHLQPFQDVQTRYNFYLNHLKTASGAYQELKKNDPQSSSAYPNCLLPDLCRHWFEKNAMTYHKQAAFDEMISQGGSLQQLNLLKETIAINLRGWNQLLQQQSDTKTWQDSLTTLWGGRSSPSDSIIPEQYAVRVFNQRNVSFIRHGHAAHGSIAPEYLCYLDSLKKNRSNLLYVNHDSPVSATLIDLETKPEYRDLFHYLSLPIDDHVIDLKKRWLHSFQETAITFTKKRFTELHPVTRAVSELFTSNQPSTLPEWMGLLVDALSEEQEGFHLPQHFKNLIRNKKELKEVLHELFFSLATDVRNLYFSQETDWSMPTRRLFLMIFYSYIKECLQASCSIHTVAVASDDELGDVAASIDTALYNLRLKKENDPKALFHVCIQALTPALLHRGFAISEKRLNLLLSVLEKINALNQEQIDAICRYRVHEDYLIEQQKIPHEREIDLSKTIESFQFLGSDHSEFDPALCRPIDWSKIQDPPQFYEAIKKVLPIPVYDFIFDCTDETHAPHDGRSCTACTNFLWNLEATKQSIAQKICQILHRKLTCTDNWIVDVQPESVAIAAASNSSRDVRVEIDFRPLFITPGGEQLGNLSLHAVITPTDTIMKLEVLERPQADDASASQPSSS